MKSKRILILECYKNNYKVEEGIKWENPSRT